MDPVNGDIRMQDNNMVLYENGAVSVTELPIKRVLLGSRTLRPVETQKQLRSKLRLWGGEQDELFFVGDVGDKKMASLVTLNNDQKFLLPDQQICHVEGNKLFLEVLQGETKAMVIYAEGDDNPGFVRLDGPRYVNDVDGLLRIGEARFDGFRPLFKPLTSEIVAFLDVNGTRYTRMSKYIENKNVVMRHPDHMIECEMMGNMPSTSIF